MYLLPFWQFLSLCDRMGCDPGSCRRPPAELSPIIHEVTALLEKIAAPIGRLDRVADGVGEGLLDNVVRVRSRLSRPISEGAAKATRRLPPRPSSRAITAACATDPCPTSAASISQGSIRNPRTFHLRIRTPQELQHPVAAPARKVPGAVPDNPRSRRSEPAGPQLSRPNAGFSPAECIRFFYKMA